MRKLFVLFAFVGMLFTVGFTEVEYQANITNADSIFEQATYRYDESDYKYIDSVITEAEAAGYFVQKSKEGNQDVIEVNNTFYGLSQYLYSSYFIPKFSSSYTDLSTENGFSNLSINFLLPDDIDEASFNFVVPSGVILNNADIVDEAAGQYTWLLDYLETEKEMSLQFNYKSSEGSFFSNFFSNINISFELIFVIILGIVMLLFFIWIFFLHSVNNRV